MRSHADQPIVALVPAHNEAENLPGTIASLRAQSTPVDRVLVISDNSTDSTAQVARDLGVEVLETVANTARKAGALNQGLATLTGGCLVLVMDADTELARDFVTAALVELTDPRVGGVGAVFHAAEPTSYLELCQRLEWTRYAEETDRTGKTFVMSGTAALIRWDALASVHDRFGRFYDENTITEDSRLSIDLKLCGWRLRSPAECRTVTETMPTLRALFLQRRRWYLGAMQNAADTGMNSITAPYWRQQVMLAVSVGLMALHLALTALAVAVGGVFAPHAFWLAIGVVFAVERVVTVWQEPWARRVFAAAVLPELAYALVLQTAYLAALWQKLTGHRGVWAHLSPEGA